MNVITTSLITKVGMHRTNISRIKRTLYAPLTKDMSTAGQQKLLAACSWLFKARIAMNPIHIDDDSFMFLWLKSL